MSYSKALDASFWALLQRGGGTTMSFLFSIILARYITPEIFGSLAILLAVFGIPGLLINAGLSRAIIQKKDIQADDYNSVYIYTVFVSISIVFFLNIFAEFFSSLSELKNATIVFRTLTATIIPSALSSLYQTQLERELSFKTITKINIVAQILSGLCAVIMALLSFEIWALLAQRILSVFLIYALNRYYSNLNLRFRFIKERFKKLWIFSYKLLLSWGISILYRDLFTVFIGRLYSPHVLADFNRASGTRDLLSKTLTDAMSSVSLPLLSTDQSGEAVKRKTMQLVSVTFSIIAPVMIGLSVLAPKLIVYVYGEQWVKAGEYLSLLAISGIFYPLNVYNLSVLQVMGRTDLFLKLEILKVCINVFITLFLVYVLGLTGLLVAIVVTSGLAYLINSSYTGFLLNYSIFSQLKDLKIPILSAGFVLIGSHLINLVIGGIEILFLVPLFILIVSTLFYRNYPPMVNLYRMIKSRIIA